MAWTLNTQGATTFNRVAYGNGYWVAVGDSGTLYYTTDPTGAWTSNTQGASTLSGVAYGNGYWVAVGVSGGLLYKATDPTGSWTSNTQGSAALLNATYGAGRWVVCGASGALMHRATDPTGAFTSNNLSLINNLNSVAYDGSTYWMTVANAGGTHNVAYTTDPTSTWTFNDQSVLSWTGVTFASGYWVMSGAGAVRYRLTDPTSTFTSNDPPGSAGLGGVVWDGTNWIIAGAGVGSGEIRWRPTAPTGTWTFVSLGSNQLNSIASDGSGTRVAVGASGALYYSTGSLDDTQTNATEKIRLVSSPMRW